MEMKEVTPLELEGLILNGFVVNLELLPCTSSNNHELSKIVGKLVDGSEVQVKCLDSSRAIRIYELYVYYKNKKWVDKVVSEVVMSGITFDSLDDRDTRS
jgi:hypothetical protein